MKKLLVASVVLLALAVVPAMAAGLGETVTTHVTASIDAYAVITQAPDTIAFAPLDPVLITTVGVDGTYEYSSTSSVGTFQSNVNVVVTFNGGDNLTLVGAPAPAPTLPTETRVTVTWTGGGIGPTAWEPITSSGPATVPLTAGKIYTVTGEARVIRNGLSDPKGDYTTYTTLTVAAAP